MEAREPNLDELQKQYERHANTESGRKILALIEYCRRLEAENKELRLKKRDARVKCNSCGWMGGDGECMELSAKEPFLLCPSCLDPVSPSVSGK